MSEESKPVWGKADYNLLEHWPKLPDGSPEKPVLAANLPDLGGQADMIIAMLRSYNIPVMTRYTGAGGYSKILFGFAGTGVDLYVPESMHQAAMDLIAPPPASEDDNEMTIDENNKEEQE
ncbi:MAG: hypothetical protein II379_05475 [Oscillospiraceae bacterium]|nr:hypothetical protein [Oscillospiraceae bacterium]